MDFSTAAQGGGNKAAVASASIDVAKVKGELHGIIRTVLQDMAGGSGKREGNEFLFPKKGQGGPGDGIRYNMVSHVWGAFNEALDPSRGKDIISFWAAYYGLGSTGEAQVEAAKQAAEAYLGWSPESPKLARPNPKQVDIPVAGPSGGTSGPTHYDTSTADHRWDYYSADGKKVTRVYRWNDFEGTGKKVVRPWCYERNAWAWPHEIDPESGKEVARPRPLLNLLDIQRRSDETIVMVEGEKAADAIEAASFLATTVAGGESGIDCTDYLPLQGRDVLLWPDNDEAGNKWLGRIMEHLKGIGVLSIKLVTPPADFKAKWDAADVPEERCAELVEEALARDPFHQGKRIADMNMWWGSVGEYADNAKPVTWLLDGVFPMKAVSVLAADGGLGKGIVILDLLLKVASKPAALLSWSLGREIKQFGRVMLYSGEDSKDDLGNRLKALDPTGVFRKSAGKKLGLLPFRNASGDKFLFTMDGQKAVKTDAFLRLERVVKEHKDLKVLVIDPISKFVDVDTDVNNRAAAFVLDSLGDLAEEAGIAIILAHHTHKNASGTGRGIIRGAGEIVNGARAAAIITPVSEQDSKKALSQAGITDPEWQGRVASFRVVKGNYKHTERSTTLLRDMNTGLLEPFNAQLYRQSDTDLQHLYVQVVREYAALGFPFCKSVKAKAGFLNRTQSVPEEMLAGRDTMQRIVEELLRVERLVAVAKKGRGTTAEWLDIPGGPLDSNAEEYEFVEGRELPWVEVSGAVDDTA